MEENAGPAKARNTGIASTEEEFIAFTDSDCVVHPYWVKELSKIYQKEVRSWCGWTGATKAERYLFTILHILSNIGTTTNITLLG